jgi:SAM-dependent methyltransferase
MTQTGPSSLAGSSTSVPTNTSTAHNEIRALKENASFLRIDRPVFDVTIDHVNVLFNRLAACREYPASTATVIHELVGTLNELRLSSSQSQWNMLIKKVREHRNFGLVHEDPFTARAFTKPRGYAGDAVMMDYIYSLEEDWEVPVASELGNNIFQYTSKSASSAGVRARREQISLFLDEHLTAQPNQQVLAVACGHLREASYSSAIRRGRFSKFLATDADPDSLALVEKTYGKSGVTTKQLDIVRLIKGSEHVGSFDLIYTTGLYDYLTQKLAIKLTASLFERLNPGGKLVIANFLPSIRDIGYMEACMDWFLIYRDRQAMANLVTGLDSDQIGMEKIWIEENRNVVFLELEKIE